MSKNVFKLWFNAGGCLALAIVLSACGKPKEIAYDQLEYQSKGALAFFNDPETGKGFTGVAQQRNKDGALTAEFPMKDGLFHGVVKEWYADGKSKSETEFYKGERHGNNIEWTADGQIYNTRVYDHDRIVSEHKPAANSTKP